MRLVDRALTKPSRCAVIPSIGIDHPDGFIDTRSEMPGKGDQWDNHIYVSVVAVREMARMIGWASPEAVKELTDQVERLQHDLVEAQNDLMKAEAILDSIDVLEGADFRARRKPGRPKKQEAVA